MIEIDFNIILVHVITFLIGVFVLWKIAWKPLVEIMKKRKIAIAKNLSDSEMLKVETEKMQAEYSRMITEIDKKAQEMILQAEISGEQKKQQIISSARDEAKTFLEKAKQQIIQEKKSAINDIRKEIAPIAISLSEKILETTIDKNTGNRLVEKFLKELDTKKTSH
ncbi:MAG: F0F1 ATP synthase subunit B [Elusimicrobia bacterium]|nr:F0F1 ATP synthase subunit B [Elusimicrobiota bacterium]